MYRSVVFSKREKFLYRKTDPSAFSLTVSSLFQSLHVMLIRSMVSLPLHSRSEASVLQWKHVFGISMPRGDRRTSRWGKPQQIQVLVFHCHMVTSACAMHQFKLTQSLVFRCHAVIRRMRNATVWTDSVFSIPLPRGDTAHAQCISSNWPSL
jgi:hypothetical protein